MYRYLSSVRHGHGSSLISFFAPPKPSLSCYQPSPALTCRHSSGIPQNDEHSRGFPSLNSGWRGRNLGENVNARQGFIVDRDIMDTGHENDAEPGRNSRPTDFMRGVMEEFRKEFPGRSELSRTTYEKDADFVHIKMPRNNTFVTVTDSKGNIKLSGSAGCLKEMKSGQKLSRYAAEATAEVVGRRARGLGLKSVVMKVKGFTYFKRKRQAILSWREGFTDSRGGRNPIVYIEDTTRRPHNGCRLPRNDEFNCCQWLFEEALFELEECHINLHAVWAYAGAFH